MISSFDFLLLVDALGAQGEEDIAWAEHVGLPVSPEQCAREAIYVICNSGMRHTVALAIYSRVTAALYTGRPVADVFGHKDKAAAIEWIWAQRLELFAELQHRAGQGPEALLAFCESLPWIGPITKYHLAKNFGADVAKPDVHLQRLADREGCSAQALCARLAAEVGLRVATVDVVLWRACAVGLLDSRTGAIA